MKFISLALLSLASTVYSQEQHFTVGLKVMIDGASGDPNDAKCTHVLEKSMVDAYAAAYPGQDTHLDSVHIDKVSPAMFEYNGEKVGTAGRWGYTGSGDNSCRRCNPMSSMMEFANQDELLEAVGTTDAFEANLLSLLQADKCFKTITDVSVSWIRGGARDNFDLIEYYRAKEFNNKLQDDTQHFTVGLEVDIVGASGDPNDSGCTHSLEDMVVKAYAAAYPDNDVHLDAVHFTKVDPGFSSNLRVGTSGRWGYTGSGDNSCRRCNPVVSAHFFGKDELLEAVGTTDAFEAKLLSLIQGSDCPSYKGVTDVTVSWMRGGAANMDADDF